MEKSAKKSPSFRDKRQIEALKPNKHQYYAKDQLTKNLYLAVRDCVRDYNGVIKTFVYRYGYGGKTQQITIGKYPEITIEQARNQANKYNDILNSEENKKFGIHPKVYLQREKVEKQRLAELNKPRILKKSFYSR